VIEEVITVRYHGAAIDNHELSEPFGIVNLNLLERGLLLVELGLQLQGEGTAMVGIDFTEPTRSINH
jgi:hypothetical protein